MITAGKTDYAVGIYQAAAGKEQARNHHFTISGQQNRLKSSCFYDIMQEHPI